MSKLILLLPIALLGVVGFTQTQQRGGIEPPVTLINPWGPATPLSGGMNSPGSLSVNEGANFDEILFTDDTDEYQKFEHGVFVSQLLMGNPDGDVIPLPAQAGEWPSGTIIGKVLSSTTGGKNIYTFLRKARDVEIDTICIDRFKVVDTTDQNTMPVKLLYDANVPQFAVFVQVKNVP